MYTQRYLCTLYNRTTYCTSDSHLHFFILVDIQTDLWIGGKKKIHHKCEREKCQPSVEQGNSVIGGILYMLPLREEPSKAQCNQQKSQRKVGHELLDLLMLQSAKGAVKPSVSLWKTGSTKEEIVLLWLGHTGSSDCDSVPINTSTLWHTSTLLFRHLLVYACYGQGERVTS